MHRTKQFFFRIYHRLRYGNPLSLQRRSMAYGCEYWLLCNSNYEDVAFASPCGLDFERLRAGIAAYVRERNR